MSKKIAVICNYVLKPNRIGGMDRFFKLFDEELKENGNEVDWFFTSIEHFEFYKNLNLNGANGASVEEHFLTRSKQQSYDVIITHFTALCSRFYKGYKALHNNAYIIAVDHNPRPLKGFSKKKSFKKKLEGLFYSKYINQFIGVSQYTVDHILKDYGGFLKKKTKVVYNGIDVNLFDKRTKENANKFVVASHLRHSKGIQDLLKALSFLDTTTRKDVIVDIYGEGPYLDELMRLRNKYALNSVVSFKGSSAKLHELFCAYSYMIQPTYMECFSLSILESLSANIPVITTTVGGNLEVVKHGNNGFIYAPGDCNALSEILKGVILGNTAIKEDTSALVASTYYLAKMVEEHIKEIPCT